MCETHASWVFLAGGSAYKVKKPVRLAFLDYSTLERRAAACREELRVNRELGGDIYERVLAIVAAPGGYRFAPDGTPGAVEYALRMRRFDERTTLAAAIAAGAVGDEDLDSVARRIAAFHRCAPTCGEGGADAALRMWEVNIGELLAQRPRLPRAVAAQRFGGAFVARHRTQLDDRARAGLVRDGHGDLRCEHVLLGEPVRIVDRIEFDPSLRRIDVGCDLAFLLMDLELAGRADAVRRVLESYRAAGGEPGDEQLVWFFAAHWAFVRAKVAVIAAAQRAAERAEPVPTEAQRLLELAERLCWRARGPVVLVLAGPPASGKSTLAGELSRRSGLEVLSSDVMRKRTAGLPPSERAPLDAYTPERTVENYRELGRCAARSVASGTGVLVDATCGTRRERRELLSALGAEQASMLFVQCRVPLACALERAAERMAAPTRVSDATPDVVARLFERYEPIDELSAAAAAVVDVDGTISVGDQLEAVAEAADALLLGTT